MSYIDGFVIAVPTAHKQKFIEHARQTRRLRAGGGSEGLSGWGFAAVGKLDDCLRLN